MNKNEKKAEIKRLLNEIESGDDETLKSVLIKMQEWGMDPKSVISGNWLSNSTLFGLTDSQKKILADPPKREVDRSGQSIDELWPDLPSDLKKDLSLSYTENLFKRGWLERDTNVLYRVFVVLDKDEKICKEIRGDRASIKDVVATKLAKAALEDGQVISPAILSSMVDYWEKYSEEVGTIPDENGSYGGVKDCYSTLFSGDADYKNTWSLFKSRYVPDASVPFPNLKKTIDRMSEGEAVAAWIWGTYSGKYRGRQVPWIYGKDGEEGKSYLGSTVGRELFGEGIGYKVISNAQAKGGKFTSSNYIGAKFILYPDCNNKMILWTELFKSLAGGGRDAEMVEEKFKVGQTQTLDARAMICSNHLPTLKRENWLLSRLMLCKIEKLGEAKDPTIDEKYKEELPGFLAFAKSCYEKLCKDNEYIQLKQETIDWVNDLIDKHEPLKRDVFLRYFELSAEGMVSRVRLKNILEVEERASSKEQEQWHEYLLSLPGVDYVRRKGGMCYVGIREKGSSSSSTEDSTEDNGFGDLL